MVSGYNIYSRSEKSTSATHHHPLDPEDESAVPFNLAPVASIPRTQVLVFNPSIPPFDDINFRRALAASIDRESIAPDYGADEATGIVAPDAPGYSESSMPIEFDLTAARASMDIFRQANPMTVGPDRLVLRF